MGTPDVIESWISTPPRGHRRRPLCRRAACVSWPVQHRELRTGRLTRTAGQHNPGYSELRARRKSQNAVPVLRIEPVAVCRPAVPGVVEPAPAPVHAVRALLRPVGSDLRPSSYFPPALAPFKNIAVHVVQTPRVGQFLADTVSVLLANLPSILVVPGVLSQPGRIISKAVNRGCSGTAGEMTACPGAQRAVPMASRVAKRPENAHRRCPSNGAANVIRLQRTCFRRLRRTPSGEGGTRRCVPVSGPLNRE